jgi:dihydrofolate reductase
MALVELPLELVVAADADRGIGKAGDLPWKLPGDMAFFRRLTRHTDDPDRPNAVIMGRKTWASIPPRFRPLRKRRNVVMTRDERRDFGEGVITTTTLDDAIAAAEGCSRIFVIGGAEIYRLALDHPHCGVVHLTRVEGTFDCDVFLPALPAAFVCEDRTERQEEGGIGYRFERWVKR